MRLRVPRALLAVPLAAWVVAFFVVPLVLLIRESFLTYSNFTVSSTPTLRAWKEAVFTRRFLDVWSISFTLAVTQTIVVVVVVFLFVYAVAFHGGGRRAQTLIMGLTLLPFFVGYFMQMVAWKPILSPQGVAHGVLKFLPPLLGTQSGVHVGLLAYIWPVAALLMYVLGVNTVDRRLVDGAANLGASPLSVFWDVVVRLSKPGIVMAAMLTFIVSFSDYLSAVYLGPPLRTLSALIADDVRLAGDYPSASAVSVVMLATTLFAIALSFRFAGRVSVSSHISTVSDRGRSDWLWRSYIVVGLLFVSLPAVSIVVFGFHGPTIPVWPIRYLSVRWYAVVFHDAGMIKALTNSAKVAVAVGTSSTILGGMAAYYFTRYSAKRLIPYTMLVVAPAVAPPLVLSLGLLVYFTQIGIWGSLYSVILGHVGLVAVFSFFIVSNRLSQIDVHLEEAAMNLGAGRVTAFRDTMLPLAIPAFVASFVVAAGISLGESVVSFFLTATTYTWPSYVKNLLAEGPGSPEIFSAATLIYGALLVLFLGALLIAVVPGHRAPLVMARFITSRFDGRRPKPPGDPSKAD
jgi:ABC-type spermidine/putrescine transport system permease subunit II